MRSKGQRGVASSTALAGLLLALAMSVSMAPAAAQPGSPPTPGVLDHLATQSAYSSLATRPALDRASQAADAQRQAAEAQARAAQIAAQSTAQAAADQMRIAEQQATIEAAILQSTVEASQTRTALEYQQTRMAMDELDRQRAATATAGAFQAAAAATSTSASMRATATRQAVEQAHRDQVESTLYLAALALLAIVLAVALYAAGHVARALRAWAHHFLPPAGNAGGAVPIQADVPSSVVIDAGTRTDAGGLPPVIVVSQPGARQALEDLLRALPPENASDPDYFE